jgi:hypothetical protein
VLRATDSDGLTGTHAVQIRPETAPLSIRSDPAGAPVSYAGTAATTPFDTNAAIGFNTTVSAAAAFTATNGRPYVFDSWEDGAARTRDITVPPTATTLTARYLENKSFGRPAAASSSEPGSDPRNAVDGDATTRWSSAYADDQWWQADLGSARQVSAVELDWESAYASQYEILSSLDGVSFSAAQQVTLSAPGAHRAAFAARTARYVRVRAIQRATVYGVSFYEARVLGPPDATAPPSTDLPLNRPASASSTDGGRLPGAFGAQGAVDGNPASSANGRLRLRLRGVRWVRGRYIARRDRAFRVIGALKPFVARQTFTVTFRRGREIRTLTVPTKRFRRGRGGGFVVRHMPRRSGWITIGASHRRSATLRALKARPVRVFVRAHFDAGRP